MYYVEGENYEHKKGMHPGLQSNKHIHVSYTLLKNWFNRFYEIDYVL